MANRNLYIASSNTATNGNALVSLTEQDINVKAIVIGNPVNAGNITIYSITNPVNGATTNIAAKFTLPTFSTTNINNGPYVIDLANGDPDGGIRLPEGGNVIIDQSMQVTVIYNENVR